MATEPDWTQAYCRTHPDPDLWFDPRGIVAAECCREFCPLLEECADWAIATRETEGVWGGMTQQMLRRLARKVAA